MNMGHRDTISRGQGNMCLVCSNGNDVHTFRTHRSRGMLQANNVEFATFWKSKKITLYTHLVYTVPATIIMHILT